MQIPFEQMQDVLYRLFIKYNFTEEKARYMARVFSETTLDGVNSHGINRVPPFIKYVENGLVKVDAEAEKAEKFGSIERWDGNFGPGIINAAKCTNRPSNWPNVMEWEWWPCATPITGCEVALMDGRRQMPVAFPFFLPIQNPTCRPGAVKTAE